PRSRGTRRRRARRVSPRRARAGSGRQRGADRPPCRCARRPWQLRPPRIARIAEGSRGHPPPGLRGTRRPRKTHRVMSDEFWRAFFDPSAPLPPGWRVGALGAFLLFCVPIGGGTPAGVLMARNAGVSPPVMAVLYFLSDLVLAVTFEPILVALAWLGRWIRPLPRMGPAIRALATRAGGGRTRGRRRCRR